MWKSVIAVFVLCFALAQVSSSSKVKISVYYNTLCKDSGRFFRNQLEPVYKQFKDIMDLQTYSYGKSRTLKSSSGDVSFRCQFGKNECYGNQMLTCAKELIPSNEEFLQFNFCVMRDTYPPYAGAKCAKELNVDYTLIEACITSEKGVNLQNEVGKTQKIHNPTLHYVPWIVINNKYSLQNQYMAESDLKFLICKSYEGKKPDTC